MHVCSVSPVRTRNAVVCVCLAFTKIAITPLNGGARGARDRDDDLRAEIAAEIGEIRVHICTLRPYAHLAAGRVGVRAWARARVRARLRVRVRGQGLTLLLSVTFALPLAHLDGRAVRA